MTNAVRSIDKKSNKTHERKKPPVFTTMELKKICKEYKWNADLGSKWN